MKNSMKIGIYARVSKNDKSQDPQNQLIPLRDYARALGGEVVQEYTDAVSGGKGDREGFTMMLEDADKRKFDLLLIWSLDRLSREGISNTFGYLERLKRNGVSIKSLQESWLDTRDDGVGRLLLVMFSWFAQHERQRISECTKAGLERAKRQGKKLGRPTGSKDSKQRRKSGYYLRYCRKKKYEL